VDLGLLHNTADKVTHHDQKNKADAEGKCKDGFLYCWEPCTTILSPFWASLVSQLAVVQLFWLKFGAGGKIFQSIFW